MKERARQIEKELEALATHAARQAHGLRSWSTSIRLPIELEVDATGEWRVAGEGLHELLARGLREAAALSSPLQRGRVFCHRCETAGCVHAAPPSARDVFAGYGPTGLPLWDDLHQALLRGGHPDVDRLYDSRPRLLALVQAGRDLKSRQLAAFGRSSKSYDVLGQVIAGWYRSRPTEPSRDGEGTDDVSARRGPRTPRAEPDRRLAVTFQAVEHRGPRRGLRLDLNVIGRTAGGEDAELVLAEHAGAPFTEPVRSARDALRALQDQARGDGGRNRSEVLGRVPGILRKLARDLVTDERRKERRTGHAEHRRKQSRPVQAALREALAATPERLLFDEHESTIVVLGRRNRVHVFSEDGRLITSLAVDSDAVDRRLRRERWRPATGPERTAFRDALGARSGGEPDGGR